MSKNGRANRRQTERQQEASLSDLAILGALSRKYVVLRLEDPSKQTSGGTGSSDLARKIRLISNQLALGIRVHRKPYLPQALPALLHLAAGTLKEIREWCA